MKVRNSVGGDIVKFISLSVRGKSFVGYWMSVIVTYNKIRGCILSVTTLSHIISHRRNITPLINTLLSRPPNALPAPSYLDKA